MNIEIIEIEQLIPYARNARTHSDEQIKQIANSIREFGFTNPVLIDKNQEIIAGHARVIAAKQIGITKIPCIRLGYLTDAQKRAYILADNRIALNSGWNDDLLKLEFIDLTELNFDIHLTGFTDADIFKYSSNEKVNIEQHWQQMPEFVAENKMAYRSIYVHFMNQDDVDRFQLTIEKKIPEKAKFIWYTTENIKETFSDREYRSES